MMDYYSNFPAPGKPEAIKEVVNECKKLLTKNELIINELTDEKILETATQVVNEMPSLGSYTGWYVSFRGDAVKEVLKKLK